MKWRLILLLSLFGGVSGALSVFGFNKTAGWILLILFAVFCSLILARKTVSRKFLHGFLSGFIASILNSLVVIIFYSDYLKYNTSGSGLESAGFQIKNFMIIMIPLAALLWGVVLGSLTLLFNMFRKVEQ